MAVGVTFPRVLGIEATGVVAECPGGEFEKGQQVCAMMDGMGRSTSLELLLKFSLKCFSLPRGLCGVYVRFGTERSGLQVFAAMERSRWHSRDAADCVWISHCWLRWPSWAINPYTRRNKQCRHGCRYSCQAAWNDRLLNHSQ